MKYFTLITALFIQINLCAQNTPPWKWSAELYGDMRIFNLETANKSYLFPGSTTINVKLKWKPQQFKYFLFTIGAGKTIMQGTRYRQSLQEFIDLYQLPYNQKPEDNLISIKETEFNLHYFNLPLGIEHTIISSSSFAIFHRVELNNFFKSKSKVNILFEEQLPGTGGYFDWPTYGPIESHASEEVFFEKHDSVNNNYCLDISYYIGARFRIENLFEIGGNYVFGKSLIAPNSMFPGNYYSHGVALFLNFNLESTSNNN